MVGVGVGDRLGQVLDQVPDGPVGVGGGGDDAGACRSGCRTASHAPAARPGRASSWSSACPRWAGPRRCRVDVVAAPSHTGSWRVDVDGLVERRPPQLDVGGLDDLAEGGSGDGAADRGVQVRRRAVVGVRRRRSTAPCSRRSGAGSARTGRPASGSATHPTPPAGSHSWPGRPAYRSRHDRPVGGQGEGEEHRRPVLRPSGAVNDPADGAVLQRHPRQVGASCRRRVDRTRRSSSTELVGRSSLSAWSSSTWSGPRPAGRCRVRRCGASLRRTAASAAPGPCARRAGRPLRGSTRTGWRPGPRCRSAGRATRRSSGRTHTCWATASSRAMSAVISGSVDQLAGELSCRHRLDRRRSDQLDRVGRRRRAG